MPDRKLDELVGNRLSARAINLHFDGMWILTLITQYKFDNSVQPPVRVPHEGIVLAYSEDHTAIESEYLARVGTIRNRVSLFILQGDDNKGSSLLPESAVPESRSESIANMLENPGLYGRRRGIPGFNPDQILE